MDPHLVRLEKRLNGIDDVLRGNRDGSVGLVEAVRRLTEEQARQGAELSALKAVPGEIAEIRKTLEARDEIVGELSRQTRKLVEAEEKRSAIREGERKALDRVSKWLKIGAGLLVLVGATGSSVGVALLRALSDTVSGLP